ncbi:hypothetical protein Tco_1409975 [Tanacetum coccineum]
MKDDIFRIYSSKLKRKDTRVPQPSGPTDIVADEAVHKELGDKLVRAATTASSLEAEQDSGNITKTRSKATPNEFSSQGTILGPRCQETMGDTIAQTRFENVSKLSNDSLLTIGNTLRIDNDRLKLDELMELCTNLQKRVLDLEKTKTTQHIETDRLKRKKLEKKRSLRTHKLKRLYKVGLSAKVESFGDEQDLGEDASKQGRRINVIDVDEDITLVNVQDDVDNEMFDVNALNDEEVFVVGQNENVVEEVVDAAQGRRINAIDADEDITLVNVQDDADNEIFDVDALTGDEVFAEQEVAAKDVNLTVDEVTLAQALAALKSVKPKVKGDVIKEPNVPVNAASAPTKVSAATTTTATIPTPRKGIVITELGTPTTTISSQQSQDKGKGIMIEEPLKPMKKKATLFQQLLEKRRKHFAAKSAEEKRNKPPTQAQQRKIICTYLKNMEGKKLKDLKNESFDFIQKMFNRALKRVNTFVDFRTDLVEDSSKRAGEELEQESTKKQKVGEDKDTTELQSLMEVILDEEELAIDAAPLAIKSLSIVGWKIHKEGKKSYYQIMRAYRKSQMYRIFSHMLKSFSREDLEDLYKLVKAKYESTRLVEDLDLLLWGDLKTMFEPHVKYTVWWNQHDYKVLERKLYDSCRVHSLRIQHVYIYMLVEKRYPLTPSTIIDMLNKKLQERIIGIKSLLNAASITAAHIRVNVAQLCYAQELQRKMLITTASTKVTTVSTKLMLLNELMLLVKNLVLACSFMLYDLDLEPLSLSLSSLTSCDLVSLTNILILCLILKASNQSLRKSLSLKLELS